jgi:hypothetical protein
MACSAVARIGRDTHLPLIETGIGPSEAKAERPAAEKGFWNRFDAMAKCRVVEERKAESLRTDPIPDR